MPSTDVNIARIKMFACESGKIVICIKKVVPLQKINNHAKKKSNYTHEYSYFPCFYGISGGIFCL